MPPANIRPALRWAGSLPFLLMAAGCLHHRDQVDEGAQAVAMGERPVAMEGTAPYFGGTIAATVTVSRGIGRGTGKLPRQKAPDLSGMDPDDAYAYLRQRQALGSPMPPVTLHLKLENLSSEVQTVEILEMNSDLGNFAVQPSLLAMAPKQVAEPDPMISQLGVTSDDIPVTVTLRINGKPESHAIQVRTISP